MTARVLIGVAVLFAVLAVALSYLGRATLRSGPFADRAVAALRDPAVQSDVADHLTDAVTSIGGGDLVAVRPLVRSLAGGIVQSPAFASLFRRAVVQAHEAVVQRGDGRVLITVADLGVLVQGVLERLSPAAARTIAAERVSTLFTLHPGGAVIDVVKLLRSIYSAAWVLAILAAVMAIGALWLSEDRRRTGWQLGIGLLIGGLALAALVIGGREIVEQLAPEGRGPAVAALWRAFLGGLQVQALLLAAAGAIVAGTTAGHLGRAGREARGALVWLMRPAPGTSPPPSLAGAGALIVVGALILLEPAAALTAVALLAGLYILYRGVAAGAMALARGAETVSASRWSLRRALRRAPPVIGAALVILAGVVILTGGGAEAPAAVPVTCNGFVALCDRPLNDVALAATHNSMASVTLPHWLFGQQDGTISDQLDQGIHGLLIDTYYGFAVRGGVRTDLETLPKRNAAEQEIGTPAVNAALRLRKRLPAGTGGTRGIFLCHGFCEIGAVTLSSALDDLRSFLVSHPGDVVVVINQDEGVTPTDIQKAFAQAGLLDLVYRGPLGPFPTLRQMIDSNQRLVVMAENDAGDVPWYHLAYAHALQETPFRFTNAAQLTDPSQLATSCRANRGPSSAPLFLVNHWVDTSPTPRPSLASVVNARGALLRRAQTCQRRRDRLPNLVAVDFYRRGDVIGVVNTLNGVSP
ncbi:MAG TPA: hypothetical protein VMF14_05440 [Solirubrobacteraceae bacterium]|nr:hypothetical protein [Solirubrobacteraceae bacterium]